MSYIWHTVFFDPIYNGLVFFIDVVPGGDVGLSIIFTVIAVKLLLLPLSLKAARTQLVMNTITPRLEEIKKAYKDNREEQARKTLELFQEYRVNPFSSILLIFVQIPIVIALYLAVYSGGGVKLPEVNTSLLYEFMPTPEAVSMFFLGMLNIAEKSLPLALLAGITQYVHTHLSMPKLTPREKNAEPSFKDDFNRSLQLQMRYVMPVIIVIAAYTISAAIALYFTVSNLMSIAQEFVVRHKGLKQSK
jgi:YidC/Oxa1 family membrane protein insertase